LTVWTPDCQTVHFFAVNMTEQRTRFRKKPMTEPIQPRELDWYDEYIEEPLRGLVKYLRNNGINTECSCAHSCEGRPGMYVQCSWFPGEDLQALQHLMFMYYARTKRDDINFKINIRVEVVGGHPYTGAEITIYDPKRQKAYLRAEIKKAERLIKGKDASKVERCIAQNRLKSYRKTLKLLTK